MRDNTTVAAFFLLAFLPPLTVAVAADEDGAPGCRLEADDPLRVQVNRMIKDGAEFQAAQTQALRDKVARLARTSGWTGEEEDAYLGAAVSRGNQASWDRTLEVAATFMHVCHTQDDGNQSENAVRLFRQFYLVEEAQWRVIHGAVDRDIAAAERNRRR